MKLIYLFIFLFYNLLSSTVIAKTIAVVNIQLLIDNNSQYIEILNQIESSQQNYLKDFESKENQLLKLNNEIEASKLILSADEINSQIDNYNNELNKFSLQIDKFNIHYQNQIINIREQVLREIIILLENYAIENNIDLILDSTSYLIASNSIDITEIINKELVKINFILKYENF